MIQPTELRIGNLVRFSDTKEICRIYQIEHRFKETYRVNDINDNDKIEPIPLTEQRLVKLGFVKQNTWFKKDDIMLSPDFNYCIYDQNGDHVGGIKIEFVHQAQNIFFSLTGNELTIK